MEYPQKLKKLRLEKNLSRKELAQQTGVSERIIYNIETLRNKKNKISYALIFSGFFKVSLDYLIGLKENR